MNKRPITLALAALILTGAVYTASAQISPVPASINYQGTLLDPVLGTRLSGTRDLEVRAYPAKDSDVTAAVWGERHAEVPLFEGVFNVVLGIGALIDGVPQPPLGEVFDGATIWIGVTVVGEAGERQERQQVASAPYALSADTSVNAIHGVPAGTMAAWGGSAAEVPEGWVACDGRTLDATAENGKYAALWQAIGAAWGGTGETDFKVPNLGGRALVGSMAAGAGANQNSDASSAGLTAHALGSLFGEETHVLAWSEMPSHQHSYADRHFTGSWDNISDVDNVWDLDDVLLYETRTTFRTYNAGDVLIHDTGATTAAAHQNMQPSLAVNFMIKY